MSATLRSAALRWQPSPLARRLLAVAAAALVLAVLTRRAEMLPLGVPALWALTLPRRGDPPARVDVDVRVDPPRCFEGEPVRLQVTASTAAALDELTVEVSLPVAFDVPDGGAAATARGSQRVELDCVTAARRWGRWTLGTLTVRARTGQRLLAATATIRLDTDLLVFPHPAATEAKVAPRTLPLRTGDHPSREASVGIEFAGIRRYVPGDPARRINWPVSTRRGDLYVTTYAPERPVDVIVVVDALTDVGPPGRSSLDLAVRGATGTAQAYLGQRDRVGVVVIGGRLRWLRPGAGDRHYYRIVEEVLRVRRDHSFVDPDVSRVPRVALPAAALVVVFSPLLDDRSLEVVRDLRERGFSLLVVDVLCADPPDEGGGRMTALALRVWRLEREALRITLGGLGVPVRQWHGEDPLELPFAGGLSTHIAPSRGAR